MPDVFTVFLNKDDDDDRGEQVCAPPPPPPIQTSVNFRDFDHEKPYFFKISTNTLKLGNLTNLKATFLAELKDFP